MQVKSGYKQTEAGMIPMDWEAMKLGKCAAFRTGPFGTTLHKSDYTDDGVPVINPMHINNGEIQPTRTMTITEHAAHNLSEFRLKAGEIIIGRRGDMGRCAVVQPHQSGWLCGTGSMIVRSATMDMRFLQRVLSSPNIISEIENNSVGTTMVNLNHSTLAGLVVQVPPAPEQRAIAEALSDVDALLGVLDRMLTKKRDLKQAAMQQLLTGQTRLPGFKAAWRETKVKDVITGFFCGPSPTCEERNIQGDVEWGVLKTTAATKEHGWDWTKHKTLPRPFWNKPHLELKHGDVIVTKAGPRHRVGVAAWVDYVPPRIIVSGKMIGLRLQPDKVVPLMLTAAISEPQPQLFLNQRTTGMAEAQLNFENKTLLETPIRLPHFAEQTAIAEALSDMDAEITALEQRRDKTRDLKQGMMQELLTGKTRLI